MARARNIKPSFFANDELSELEPLARILFIGMWTITDFKGCFEYKPKRLKVQILPYDDCNIEQLVSDLDKCGFISIYSVLGQHYIKVINFGKHQNPHKNERESGSYIPDISPSDEKKPENSDHLRNIEINREQDGTAPADSLNLIPDSLNADSKNTHTLSENENSEIEPAESQNWQPDSEILLNVIRESVGVQAESVISTPEYKFHIGNFNAHWENKIDLTENQKTRKFAAWLIQEFKKSQAKPQHFKNSRQPEKPKVNRNVNDAHGDMPYYAPAIDDVDVGEML